MYALNSQCPYDLFGVRVWLIAIFQVKLNMLLCPKKKKNKKKEFISLVLDERYNWKQIFQKITSKWEVLILYYWDIKKDNKSMEFICVYGVIPRKYELSTNVWSVTIMKFLVLIIISHILLYCCLWNKKKCNERNNHSHGYKILWISSLWQT